MFLFLKESAGGEGMDQNKNIIPLYQDGKVNYII